MVLSDVSVQIKGLKGWLAAVLSLRAFEVMDSLYLVHPLQRVEAL